MRIFVIVGAVTLQLVFIHPPNKIKQSKHRTFRHGTYSAGPNRQSKSSPGSCWIRPFSPGRRQTQSSKCSVLAVLTYLDNERRSAGETQHVRSVNLFNLSLQHSSSRGSFIAYQTCIRRELVASFSAAVHRTLFHSTRNSQKYFSTDDEAIALKHCQFIFDCFFFQFLQQRWNVHTNPLFQSPAYNNHTDSNQGQKD